MTSLPLLSDPPAFTPAPERQGLPSAWALTAADLGALGCGGSPSHVFGALQRVATWRAGGGTGDGPVLGRSVRAALAARVEFSLPRLVEVHTAADGSSRCVLQTTDGHRVEAVHMPRAVKNPRVTLCISSQVGCAMGCTFCATGSMGIVRNLTAGEIVGEVLTLMQELGPKSGHQLNLVFMGMGEPLHNLDHVARAIEILCDEGGVGLSKNRITVSTSGLVPGIQKMAALRVRPLLAVSVNATTDETRSRIMPVNRSFNLTMLKDTLLAFPFRHGEKVLLEYVLLRGENDTLDDARRLADFAAGLKHNVNLIPLNEHTLTSHKAPEQAWVWRFADALRAAGCLVTVRNNRGRDVRGACGQLVQESQRPARGRP